MRQQCSDELLLFNATGFGFKHQSNRGIFAGFIAHHIEHRQDAGLKLHLICTQGFLTGLHFGIGELFNFFQYFLRTDTNGQLGHHQLPLTARHVFNLPACANFQ